MLSSTILNTVILCINLLLNIFTINILRFLYTFFAHYYINEMSKCFHGTHIKTFYAKCTSTFTSRCIPPIQFVLSERDLIYASGNREIIIQSVFERKETH